MKYFLAFMFTVFSVGGLVTGDSYGQQKQSEVQAVKNRRLFVFANTHSGAALGVSPTATAIVVETEITDIQNSYNNSTGVFTAPETGQYRVTLNIGTSGARDVQLRARKNGATTVLSSLVGVATFFHYMDGMVTLAATETLNFTVENFGTAATFSGGIESNYLIIERAF